MCSGRFTSFQAITVIKTSLTHSELRVLRWLGSSELKPRTWDIRELCFGLTTLGGRNFGGAGAFLRKCQGSLSSSQRSVVMVSRVLNFCQFNYVVHISTQVPTTSFTLISWRGNGYRLWNKSVHAVDNEKLEISLVEAGFSFPSL